MNTDAAYTGRQKHCNHTFSHRTTAAHTLGRNCKEALTGSTSAMSWTRKRETRLRNLIHQ